MQRLKESYLVWVGIVPHIPKGARYTIGARVENKLLTLLEATYVAYFTPRAQRAEKLAGCILELDTLKFLVSVAWEGKLVSHKQYETVAVKLEEVGKMLGGWRKSLGNPDKKNHTL